MSATRGGASLISAPCSPFRHIFFWRLLVCFRPVLAFSPHADAVAKKLRSGRKAAFRFAAGVLLRNFTPTYYKGGKNYHVSCSPVVPGLLDRGEKVCARGEKVCARGGASLVSAPCSPFLPVLPFSPLCPRPRAPPFAPFASLRGERVCARGRGKKEVTKAQLPLYFVR